MPRCHIYVARHCGSTAVLCALDITKAFDKINHFGHYIKLMNRNIPCSFLDILICWYSKNYAFVRWGNSVSQQFQVLASVKQGGVLSPILFSVFLNSIIICKIRTSGYGACIGSHYFGCLLYADDIMLVSHSVNVMQIILDICSEEAVSLDFTFNTKKSDAIRIGSRYKNDCVSLVLCGVQLQYVQQVKYLGVMLVSARSFILNLSC